MDAKIKKCFNLIIQENKKDSPTTIHKEKFSTLDYHSENLILDEEDYK